MEINRSHSALRTRESHNVTSIVVDSSMARARGWSTRLIPHRSQVWVRTAERYKTPTDVVIMDLERFEDFLGLHTPTRWYKFSTGFGSLSKGLLRVELAYLRRRARRSRGKPCRPMLLGTVGLGALTAG